MADRPSLAAGMLVAGHRAARLLERQLAELGLSAGEAMVLANLREGAMTMGAVMDALQIQASTVTSLVGRLERAGLVERRRNPADARSLLVHLTPAGTDASRDAQRVFAALDRRLSAAGPEAVRGHAELLGRLEQL
jgi:DNA-binding MarR family transcriptional regulator